MHIFITRPLPNIAYHLLDEEGITYTIWDKDVPQTREELIELSLKADGIINADASKFDHDLLEKLAHLKVISLTSVGFNNIDIAAAKKFDIKIGHTPNVLSQATADIAFLLLLATSRKAFFHHKRIINGTWGMFQPTGGLGIELYGKTLGIFGLGKIGLEMARKCHHAYGMNIIYHNRTSNEDAEKELNAKYVTMDELLKESDVISAHSPLTEQTKGTFNKDAFGKMKSKAIFINTGRGALHVEQDLIDALNNKQIWGAGLDVFEQEPTSTVNPLLYMENVCTLPHIGSATEETRARMAELAAKNLIAALKGYKMPAEVKKVM
ncbi:2-hydroxyacid dehydrogenase [Fulvivirga sediminis]|uniref:Glyoxylate/hydroxypyruvate reductase B n=1 Tax=Fulvivirga sediminis TaxID=2803949 RepID=A0A937FB09_9BACT|nr:D-glycerate dehydrogenase [Fulvivirga sediminis]MBL3657183.1 D-glycerate dehydrogenase [Fulvivirga sediminis]